MGCALLGSCFFNKLTTCRLTRGIDDELLLKGRKDASGSWMIGSVREYSPSSGVRGKG